LNSELTNINYGITLKSFWEIKCRVQHHFGGRGTGIIRNPALTGAGTDVMKNSTYLRNIRVHTCTLGYPPTKSNKRELNVLNYAVRVFEDRNWEILQNLNTVNNH